MFQGILVPLDGSKRAEQAIPVAAHLARSAGGSLLLVRVVDPLREFRIYSAVADAYLQETLETEHCTAVAYLERMAASSELVGIETRCVVLCGQVATMLLQVAQQENSDLIVLCSHGATGFKRWALGSVAQKVARHSPAPVLILRERTELSAHLPAEGVHPVRVLVPLDGSVLAEAAISPAIHLSCALSAPQAAQLHLVQIVPLEEPMQVTKISREGEQRYELIPEEQAQAVATATAYVHAVQQRLQKEVGSTKELPIASSVIVDPDIATTLLKIAEGGEEEEAPKDPDPARANRCDMIALATHGRSGPARWVMGSIAERLLGATRLPLLIVAPRTADR